MTKIFGAIVRALFVGILFLYPSVLIAGGLGNVDLFVQALCLLGVAIVMVEYMVEVPAIIEFRYAPPYNRMRFLLMMVLCLVLLAALGPNTFTGGNASLILPVANSFEAIFSWGSSPVQVLAPALTNDPTLFGGNLTLILSLVFGTMMFGAITFGIYLWISPWPLSAKGFNLWPNMPSFNARAGERASIKILQVAILSLALALLLPYIFAFFIEYCRNSLGMDFVSSKLVVYWTIFLWAAMPAMAIMRSVSLMKLAFLAENMRRHPAS